MALTQYDKDHLDATAQQAISDATAAWEAANAKGDAAGMAAAHAAAQAIRDNNGYAGGADGNFSHVTTGSSGVPSGVSYGSGSGSNGSADGALLAGAQGSNQNTQQSMSEDLEKQIKELQDLWAKYDAEGNEAGKEEAHKQAELLRMSAGLTGGTDGSQLKELPKQQIAAILGGYTADEVEQWVNAFKAASSGGNAWHNGFSAPMNLRSIANFVRQQMKANSDAWAGATADEQAYLHDQNVKLAQILAKNNGGAQSTYNAATGRWETENANLGYGYYTGGYNDRDWAKTAYGMTDEQIDAYRNDTDRYYNYVDQGIIRNWWDESSGYTGTYAQFVNGPYGQLLTDNVLGRTPAVVYTDLIGDGFGYGEGEGAYAAPRDSEGNIVPQTPLLKDNNTMTDYTKSKAAYVDEHGIIQPGILDGKNSPSAQYNMWLNGGTYVEDPGENYGIRSVPSRHSAGFGLGGFSGSISTLDGSEFGSSSDSGSYENYINQTYDADLQAQLAQLEAAYNQSIAELDREALQTDADYTEQRRQATGNAERDAAAWREIANAQGVNSGAIGQSMLANSGMLQSNLNALNSAQATAQSNVAAQRAILAQMYQLQIQQAQAENDYERAQALYNEATRVDEALREEEQFNAQMGLSYAQLLMGG